MLFDRTTEMVKKIIQLELNHITRAVDATMGNGNDTLFLSQIVGEHGRVYAFDLQKQALEVTRQRLAGEDVANVELILDSHEHLESYVEAADLIMFNLGYLPKGDKTIRTKSETTCKAIEAGLRILTDGGMMTIISYYGHPGGLTEKEDVKRLLSGLNPSHYDVLELNGLNKVNNPPIVSIVRKKYIA